MTVSIHEQIRFSLFQVNDFSYATRRLDNETQSFYTFSFISEGSVQVTADGRRYFARTGDIMVHSPNIPFTVHADQPGTHMYMNLALNVMDQVDFFQLNPFPRVIPLLNPLQFQQTFVLLKSVWSRSEDRLRDMQATMLVFQLLYDIIESARIEETTQNVQKPSIPDSFAQVIPYMERNLDQSITRDQLAQVAHLNPIYFSRLFHKVYGVSPMHMIQKLRMKRALQMLEDSRETIESIAEQCGFYDASYFIKVFQRTYKTTPGKFRRKLDASKKRKH